MTGSSDYISGLIPHNVITLFSSIMTKWKTRLEIWKDEKKKYQQMG